MQKLVGEVNLKQVFNKFPLFKISENFTILFLSINKFKSHKKKKFFNKLF